MEYSNPNGGKDNDDKQLYTIRDDETEIEKTNKNNANKNGTQETTTTQMENNNGTAPERDRDHQENQTPLAKKLTTNCQKDTKEIPTVAGRKREERISNVINQKTEKRTTTNQPVQ